MRILRFFVQFGVLALIVAAFVWLVGGTIWLRMATIPFQQEVKTLTEMNKQFQSYTQRCQSAPSSTQDSSPIGVQIRFVDDQSYVVELVCSLIESQPIELHTGKLPPLITRAPGSAGFFYSNAGGSDTGVDLVSLGKHLSMVLEKDTFSIGKSIAIPDAAYPQNSCKGFGFSCCSDQSGVGDGVQKSVGVLDCPTSCFERCSSVPFVELFTSDPLATFDLHEINLSKESQSVTFSYAVTSTNSTVASVSIDYGDGSNDSATTSQGIFSHTYTCASGCRYTVKIAGKDALGKSSLESPQSTLYIVRK